MRLSTVRHFVPWASNVDYLKKVIEAENILKGPLWDDEEVICDGATHEERTKVAP